jgi:DNA polymerase III delta prime subunit
MTYSFSTLLPADFEDLVRDLVGRKLAIRFEGFSAGPDGGIDGRHSQGGETIILQAKHYAGSKFSDLKSTMKDERASIDALAPSRYILATSHPLSPQRKKVLAEIIGPALVQEDDILGPVELNDLLREFPEVAKAHIKLWLSGTAVLEQILEGVVRAAAQTYTAISRAEIEAKVEVYAPNPSFDASKEILEAQHVLIISGPPGVGKTTLAEMLTYAYIGDAWDLVAIRSLDDGFAAIDDHRKQIFLFDDFLGRIALDAKALASKDSDLARFMRRVASSPNARFILTTRAYIFEEARRFSEYLADKRLDISKYVLDVGVYTRRIRARILYNHLLVARTPKAYVHALVKSGKLSAIIDHPNYNPRVIEWMTDGMRLADIAPGDYPDAFVAALKNPRQLWDTAFRTHIPEKCRHLLLALFFCSEYGVEIDDLKRAFDALHARLSQKYGSPRDPKDFEESIRILEGGFITVRDRSVRYVNPSFRDYMNEYVDDLDLLMECARAAQTARGAEAVWKAGTRKELPAKELRTFALAFVDISDRFDQLPVWRRRPGDSNSHSVCDTANAARIEQLLAWWQATKDARFMAKAMSVAANPLGINPYHGFSAWLDGATMIDLVRKLKDGGYFDDLPQASELAELLEAGLVRVLQTISVDELESLVEAIEENDKVLSPAVSEAAMDAIRESVVGVEYSIEATDSESSLEEQIRMMQKLGPKAGISDSAVAVAVEKVQTRIAQLEDQTSVESSPAFTGSPFEPDAFDDNALKNLFSPLLQA